MKSIEELKTEIEHARRKLDNAIGKNEKEELCYKLSLDLDRLIEEYIAAEEEVRAC